MSIKKSSQSDLKNLARIYAACFPRELNHEAWIESGFNAKPKSVYYHIEVDEIIVGYILWSLKNGFRENTIIELEQIGIHPTYSGKGFGKQLIKESLNKFKEHVKALGHEVGAVLVTTSEGNFAEQLYKLTLGVERVALIPGYGSGNELILYRKLSE